MIISTLSPLAVTSFFFSIKVFQRDGTKPAQRLSLAGVQWLNVQILKKILCHDHPTVKNGKKDTAFSKEGKWELKRMKICMEEIEGKTKRHLEFPEIPFPCEGAIPMSQNRYLLQRVNLY